MPSEVQNFCIRAFTILKGPNRGCAITGFGWRYVVFPAMVIVYKYGMRNGEVDAGHTTGARPKTTRL
jgi:hypothetical protein